MHRSNFFSSDTNSNMSNLRYLSIRSTDPVQCSLYLKCKICVPLVIYFFTSIFLCTYCCHCTAATTKFPSWRSIKVYLILSWGNSSGSFLCKGTTGDEFYTRDYHRLCCNVLSNVSPEPATQTSAWSDSFISLPIKCDCIQCFEAAGIITDKFTLALFFSVFPYIYASWLGCVMRPADEETNLSYPSSWM